LRKTLGLQQGKKRFAKKEVTADICSTPKHLELLLVNAERAWAHAMELKRNHSDTHGSKVPSHKRHHAASRLQKAVEWADKLLEFSDGLQTKAYAETMMGYEALDHCKFQNALDHFTIARTCYESITGDADATTSALAHAAVDSLDPSIRYCAYNLRIAKGDEIADIGKLMEMLRKGKSDDILEGQLANLLSKSLESKAQGTSSIEWRNKMIPIKNPKVAQAIINAQEVSKVVPDGTDGETSFDQIISAWWDAQNMIDGLVREDGLASKTAVSSKSKETTENLQWLQSYIAYSRILATMDRNQAMIHDVQNKMSLESTLPSLTKGHAKYLAKKARQGGKVAKKQDLARLWDETIRGCDEMLELYGVEQDPALQAIWSCRRDLAQSQRYVLLHL
jgi:signal recognition particle subunit SRP68